MAMVLQSVGDGNCKRVKCYVYNAWKKKTSEIIRTTGERSGNSHQKCRWGLHLLEHVCFPPFLCFHLFSTGLSLVCPQKYPNLVLSTAPSSAPGLENAEFHLGVGKVGTAQGKNGHHAAGILEAKAQLSQEGRGAKLLNQLDPAGRPQNVHTKKEIQEI